MIVGSYRQLTYPHIAHCALPAAHGTRGLLLQHRLITCNRLSCQDALIHKLRSARLPPRSPKADPDHLLANAQEEPRAALICGWWLQRGLQSIARAQRPSASAARNRNKGKTLGGERGRNRIRT